MVGPLSGGGGKPPKPLRKKEKNSPGFRINWPEPQETQIQYNPLQW